MPFHQSLKLKFEVHSTTLELTWSLKPDVITELIENLRSRRPAGKP